jgi:cation diffusion facilitator family transporter
MLMRIDRRTAAIKKVLLVTLFLNLVVLSIKLSIGFMTGSLSLIADAVHSLTDSMNNILGLIVNRYSSPVPDREHPYGHQKVEAVGAICIAVLLSVAGIEILKSAIERCWQPSRVLTIAMPELWLLLLVLGINIFVAHHEKRQGQRLQSSLLIADAHHTMSDVWVTITVLLSLLGTVFLRWQWLDIAVTIPVAGLIWWSAWTVARENIPLLIDEIAVPSDEIYQVVMSIPEVIHALDIKSRGVLGKQCFMEMNLIVMPVYVESAHLVMEKVVALLQEKYYPVQVNIHIEPLSYRYG